MRSRSPGTGYLRLGVDAREPWEVQDRFADSTEGDPT
jgi:hypothetical protein